MSRRTVWIGLGVLALSSVLVAAAYSLGRQASARSDSPLAAYPGFGHQRADELRFKAEERRREELIASCMRRHGFVYSPSPALEPESSSVMPDRAGPNEHYVGSRTPSRQRAYWLALVGSADPSDESASRAPAACTKPTLRSRASTPRPTRSGSPTRTCRKRSPRTPGSPTCCCGGQRLASCQPRCRGRAGEACGVTLTWRGPSPRSRSTTRRASSRSTAA
jgi:hypothetical protein